MTVSAYNKKFDDEHQVHFKAVSELETEDNERQEVAFQNWEQMKKGSRAALGWLRRAASLPRPQSTVDADR